MYYSLREMIMSRTCICSMASTRKQSAAAFPSQYRYQGTFVKDDKLDQFHYHIIPNNRGV